jgi:predicted DCC family thiol-disulfide oxidoreductase YuxK
VEPVVPPNRPVLVYDADCSFCTRSARSLGRHLHPPAAIAPWQGLDLAAAGLTVADVRSAAWWLDADGRRWRGHEAIGQALVAARGWRAVCGHLILVPPLAWLARPIYAVVARNRSKMPGGTDACEL